MEFLSAALAPLRKIALAKKSASELFPKTASASLLVGTKSF